jgi:hypothetical protein
MMKRLTWFVTGAAAGAVGAGYAKKKVKQTASTLAPANVARSGAGVVRRRSRDLVDALREGRLAMRHREDELRARRDGRVRHLDEQLGPDEQLLVDGRPVEPGRIVVMRRDA